ncbi:cyclic GMP-AMP synthase-like receptor 3 [Oculina patagonica]
MSVLHGLLIAGHLLEDGSEGNVALVADRCARIINSVDERNKLLGGEITWVWPWAQADDSLTRKLRHYSNNHVKVDEADMAHTRMLVKDYVEDRIMRYCRQKSKLPILKVEYSGSAYERLETEPADKVKVMVVLKTTKSWLWGQEVSTECTSVPGYVYLKTRWNSKFCRYADPERYLDPERFGSGWLHSLVEQAVENFRDSSPFSDVHLDVYSNGPSVELDVIKSRTNEILLTADLIPCFEVGSGDFFVAKPYTGRRCVSSPELLWRQSFLLLEKEMLENVFSGDGGNSHELYKIVKTIVNREPGPLGRLDSYHLKTVFMHYISERRQKWNDKNALAYHFLGFLGKLQSSLENGNLPHYWLSGVNILDDIDQELLINMAIRSETILNSRAEMNEILLASHTYWLPNSFY